MRSLEVGIIITNAQQRFAFSAVVLSLLLLLVVFVFLVISDLSQVLQTQQCAFRIIVPLNIVLEGGMCSHIASSLFDSSSP